MRFFRISNCALLAIAGSALLCGMARAQSMFNEANLATAYEHIQARVVSEDFDTGLQMLDAIFRYWGDEAGSVVGDRYGHFFYLQGLLCMGKNDIDRANSAFRTCHSDYPDTDKNEFVVHAKAMRGVCLLALEDYPDAVKILKEAYDEAPRDKPEPDRGLIALNLARALLKSGETAEALGILYKPLDNPESKSIYREAAFAIMAEEWALTVPFEQARDFIWKYGEIGRNAPFDRRLPRNSIFQHHAEEAIMKNAPFQALLWYAQMLPPSEIVAHHEAKIETLKRRKPPADHPLLAEWETEFQQALIRLEEAKTNQGYVLFGTGATHFRLENHVAAFSIFQHLADHFPEHPQQPEILYNAVASAVRIERWPDIRTYGLRFMDQFPEHELLSEVARIMVESVFGRQIYDESWTTSQEVRQRLQIGSDARDVPDFIAGASLFHLEQFQEARVELEAYTDHYPAGARLEPASYYLGAANVKQFRWLRASEIFDRFLEDYPDSGMRPGVLYLDGLAHFALGNYERSLALVTELQAKFPSAEEIPASWNLTGDLLGIIENPAPLEQIEAAYLKARDLSRSAGGELNAEISAYASWKLIAIHDAVMQWEKAVTYFDDFQKHHAESSHRLDALAAALNGLHQKKRTREAVSHLERHIREIDPAAIEFDELFGTYRAYLEENLPPDQSIAALRAFAPTTEAEQVKHWLIIAEIEHLENSENPNQASLDKRLMDLEIAVEKDSMPNYGVIKVARYNRDKRHLNRARELYKIVVEKRPDRGYLETAVLDLATLDATSDDPAAVQAAFENFTRIIDEFDNPELYESATMGLGRILFDQENFDEAEYYLSYYLTQNQWVQARAEANFKLAQCYEKKDAIDEAIKLYAITYVNFPGTLEWSTAAYLRAAHLLKDSDREGDALFVLIDLLKRLGHLEHKNIAEGRRLFEDWKAEWVAKKESEEKS